MIDKITSFLNKIFGNKSDRDIKEIIPLVQSINSHFKTFQSIDVNSLRAKTSEFQLTIRDGLKDIDESIKEIRLKIDESTDVFQKEDFFDEVDKLQKSRDEKLEVILMDILPEAFAVMKRTAQIFKSSEEIKVRATDMDRKLALEKEYIDIEGDEAIYQTSWDAAGNEVNWDMLHYDVQLIGGVVLHQGKISEMATGEGKTLVATLPAYLNGLTGLGVHIVTVNDYLARRDSEWMGPILEFLGVSVDCIDKYQPHSEERKAAYKKNVVYGTNNEFGFDYLRDNMAHDTSMLVQRKLHYAMVDEVDSVLVDDARTPLIISGPVPKGDEQEYESLMPIVRRLYEAQKKLVSGFLTSAKKLIAEGDKEEGPIALLRAFRALPKHKPLIKYLSETGIRTKLQKVEGFYMQEQGKEMPKIDKELLFVIDEKNNSVDMTDKGIDMITEMVHDKEFFIMPDLATDLSAIDDEAISQEEKVEKKDAILQDYSIKSERVHAVQQLLKAYTLFEKDVEYVVMNDQVKIVDENTGRIMEGRRFSDGLHQALEAKEQVKIEAATQTYASVTLQNYFRMYHKLSGMTGTAETEAGEFWEIYKLDVVVIPTNLPIARDDMNDRIYKTMREKFNAIIAEVNKCTEEGRPVLVGTTSVEVSELLSKMLKMRGVRHNVLNAKQHQREADVVAEAGKPGAVTIATNMAGRGTDIKLGQGVKEAGGLAILGTERHDSRRIDRQLRGRSGRQGDPGSSVFFVSLEDNLMRLFGSERIAKTMDRFGFKEGEVLEHSMVTKSLERAQKKVEENNFGIRKRLLEYDDVMNIQRENIYKKRKHALWGDRLSVDINNSLYDLCDELTAGTKVQGNYEVFKQDCIRFFGLESNVKEGEFESQTSEDLSDALYLDVQKAYQEKSEGIAKMCMPFIRDVYKNKRDTVQNVVIPFTDGNKVIQVVVNLEDAYNSDGVSIIRTFEKNISLAIIDETWKTHLKRMDDLKQSVQSAVYEQKDPLIIYKMEAYNLYERMLINLNKEISNFIFKGKILTPDPNEVKEAERKREKEALQAHRNEQTLNTNGEQKEKREPVRVGQKIGRNAPCPCGSGKKHKQCCGKA